MIGMFQTLGYEYKASEIKEYYGKFLKTAILVISLIISVAVSNTKKYSIGWPMSRSGDIGHILYNNVHKPQKQFREREIIVKVSF